MKEAEMRTIAALIDRVLRAKGDAQAVESVRGEVHGLCEQFPL
jgi:glycine/serine hydroxymethyltransferase